VLLRVPPQKKTVGVRSGDRGSHATAFDVQSIFLDMIRSTSAEHLPRRALELRRKPINL
jgi:hypothetical protein